MPTQDADPTRSQNLANHQHLTTTVEPAKLQTAPTAAVFLRLIAANRGGLVVIDPVELKITHKAFCVIHARNLACKIMSQKALPIVRMGFFRLKTGCVSNATI